MDIINNYAYKVSAFMSGGMFIKVCVQRHVPSWYIAEDQQYSAWQLFGWAHLSIGITAFVCSTTWEKDKKNLQYLLKFGVFAFTLATYLYMGPYRKIPANKEEAIMTYLFALLSASMALDFAAYSFDKSQSNT
eukprot:456772_1